MKTINTTRLVIFDNENHSIKVIGFEKHHYNEWKYQKVIFQLLGKHDFSKLWFDDKDDYTYQVDFNKLKEFKLV